MGESCATGTCASSAGSGCGRAAACDRAGRKSDGAKVAEVRSPYRVGDVFGRHGPEPLASTFSAARLGERLKGRSARLKTLLLDQSFVAGVGNIYADEALWRARLHPMRRADTLTPVEVARLHRAVRAVLRQGIDNRGSSFGDYVDADGAAGRITPSSWPCTSALVSRACAAARPSSAW